QNQQLGVSDEKLRENEKEIFATSAQRARDRIKGNFILIRIAEAEKIEVNADEFNSRVEELAQRYRTTREKMLKELGSRNALGSVEEEILIGKVLDFLGSNVNVTAASEPGK